MNIATCGNAVDRLPNLARDAGSLVDNHEEICAVKTLKGYAAICCRSHYPVLITEFKFRLISYSGKRESTSTNKAMNLIPDDRPHLSKTRSRDDYFSIGISRNPPQRRLCRRVGF